MREANAESLEAVYIYTHTQYIYKMLKMKEKIKKA